MSSSENMVERVALIFARYADNFLNAHASEPSDAAWEDFSPSEQLASKEAARAAIEAMMEMDGAMWVEGRIAFENEATKFNAADRFEMASAIADRAPENIFRAMLRTSLTGDTK